MYGSPEVMPQYSESPDVPAVQKEIVPPGLETASNNILCIAEESCSCPVSDVESAEESFGKKRKSEKLEEREDGKIDSPVIPVKFNINSNTLFLR